MVVTITRFDAGGGVDQTSIDEGSSLLLLLGKVIVSRAQGQARFRSQGFNPDNFDIQRQVAHHFPDDEELLIIFQPEEGLVWLDDIE